jgi:sugar-specific transcriptional regulator TrmB
MSNLTEYELLGLEFRDMRVYESLYEADQSSLRTIAVQTGLNRGTVYEIIKKLSGLGLVSFTQSGERRRYTAADPEVLIALIRERRDQLKHLEGPATRYAAALQTRKRRAKSQYNAQFYEGDEGVASILRDVLQTVQSLAARNYCVISSQRASNFIYTNFKSFSRQRAKLDIFVRVISDAPAGEKLVLAERRQLHDSGHELNGYTIVYGDKTALISLSGTNELSGVVITDVGTANMQRLVFEQLWEHAA